MTGRDRLHRDRCGTISIDPEEVRPDDNRPDDPPDDFSRPDLYDPYGALAVPRWVDNALTADATWEMQPGEPTPQERLDQNTAEFFDAAADLADQWHGVLPDELLVGLFANALSSHAARRAEDDHYADLADANSY